MVHDAPKMKLSAYIISTDAGFAPNPFGRVCTLACCKPALRRHAQEHDIVVGIGCASSGFPGHLIYAMKVSRVLTFETYWKDYRSKRPSDDTAISRCGDNIYHRVDGRFRRRENWFHGPSEKRHDLSGKNVLVASEFFYFGDLAPRIPGRFRKMLPPTQGHKNTRDPEKVLTFWEWVKEEAAKLGGSGRLGMPLEFDDDGCVRNCV
jgi:hypothetical protein